MKKSILLIDDESVFRMLNEKIISLTGIDCEIQVASSGDEALKLINKYWTGREAVPDVIFIDLDMPLMDGFEFVRVFQSMDFPHKEKTTLVILTSSIDDRDRKKATAIGVKHFISKPLTEQDVKRILME